LSENNSKPETRVQITLPYKDPETAASIQEATAPDNKETPPDITIHSTTKGTTLQITVIATTGMATLIATIDDLLSCIQAAEKTLQEIE
jgi:tRNA threonylcarbamoyladenosine modification (KEOPS) complex  Pcc1 subunit